MKYNIIILLSLVFLSCKQSFVSNHVLQSHIDSLENKLANTYKPGFGEFMGSIQIHHSKLWFAGQNQNWKLADFEIHEIMEAVENIKKFQTERKESKEIDMLAPAIDSMNHAIEQKNSLLFNSSFILFTNTCNQCHRATDFGFNIVKIPDNPPFSNQDFKLPQSK